MSLEGVSTCRKGPRVISMELGDDGYGFHMYTNKQLKGQYVKTISESGNAIKAGLMVGDRVVEVDGENVEGMSHQEVVSLIRKDTGEPKQLLVVDRETEEIFKRQGQKVSRGSYVEVTEPGSMQDHLNFNSMADAIPKGKKKQDVKGGDWATKTAVFNEL